MPFVPPVHSCLPTKSVTEGIYTAADHKDTWRIALIDKLVHVQRTPGDLREQAAAMGKRLIRLAHALHPWIEFSQLEQIFAKYDSVGCLSTVHAWINHHLDIPVEEAVLGYLHSAMNACITEASKVIPLNNDTTKDLMVRLATHNRPASRPQRITQGLAWTLLLQLNMPEHQHTSASRNSPVSLPFQDSDWQYRMSLMHICLICCHIGCLLLLRLE